MGTISASVLAQKSLNPILRTLRPLSNTANLTLLVRQSPSNFPLCSLSLQSPPSHPPSVAFLSLCFTLDKHLSSFKYIPGCFLHILTLTETWLPPKHPTSSVVLSHWGYLFPTSCELQSQVSSWHFLDVHSQFQTRTPSPSHTWNTSFKANAVPLWLLLPTICPVAYLHSVSSLEPSLRYGWLLCSGGWAILYLSFRALDLYLYFSLWTHPGPRQQSQ